MWTLIRPFLPWFAGAAVAALAIWYILDMRGDLAAQGVELEQKETRIMELNANAVQREIEAQQDIDARDAAVEAQKAATEEAKRRARSLEQKMRASNESCFDRAMPVDVLDSLRD